MADMLSFLGKVDYKRSSISNIPPEDIPTEDNSEDINEHAECEVILDYSSSNDSIVTTPLTRQKSKRLKLENRILDLLEDRRKERNEIVKSLNQMPEDEIDLFCKSIAISLKKLRPQFIHEAKLKIMQLVYDLETRITDHTSSFSSNSRSSYVSSPSPQPT